MADLRSAESSSFAQALQTLAQGLRSIAASNAQIPDYHVPPAPLSGPARLSPSLDDWLHAGLLTARRDKGKKRHADLAALARSLDLLATEVAGAHNANAAADPSRLASAILRDPSYNLKPLPNKPPEKSLFERFIEWLAGIFGKLFGGALNAASASPTIGKLLAAVVLAVVGVALIALVFQLVWRTVLTFHRRSTLESIGEVIGASPSARGLLDEAAQLAAQGRFGRAVAVLFRASLVALDRSGAVRYDAARTAGEYRRAVRRARSAASEPFDRLARSFTFAAYAERPTGEAEWNAAENAYRDFEMRVGVT